MRTIKFVFGYARRYVKALVITIVCMITLVGLQLLTPWVIRTLVSAVQAGTWDAASSRFITVLALSLLGLYLLRAVLNYLKTNFAHIAGWGVVADARHTIYEHLQRLTLRYYAERQTGQMMSRMVNDSDMFESLIAHAAPDIMVNLLTFGGVSVILLRLNWRLLLLSLIPIPFVILGMRGFAHYVRPAFRESQKKLADLIATVSDNLQGVREIKAFTMEEREAERIEERIQEHRVSRQRALRMMGAFQSSVDFFASTGTIIILYFGGKLAFQQVLPIADLVAFFLYLEMFYQPVRALSGALEGIQQALAGGDRVAELLDEIPEVYDNPRATALQGRAQGHLAFEDMTFSYTGNDNVLEGINLDVPANTVVALVGPTGVGKTTLASLIPRFYDVTAGRILLDGQDIRGISLHSLRAQISMVLQDVFLFHGTVRENILFGRPDATEAEVLEAARVANATEFIDRLPDGLDTIIGERGVKLSGGQKQRLAIARAVLKNAPILILDEATSSVDTETELLIQEALERLMVGRTTIIIAHRLSTIRNANKIVVLEGKHIVQCGTHQELMACEGLYRRLNEVQRRIEPPAEAA